MNPPYGSSPYARPAYPPPPNSNMYNGALKPADHRSPQPPPPGMHPYGAPPNSGPMKPEPDLKQPGYLHQAPPHQNGPYPVSPMAPPQHPVDQLSQKVSDMTVSPRPLPPMQHQPPQHDSPSHNNLAPPPMAHQAISPDGSRNNLPPDNVRNAYPYPPQQHPSPSYMQPDGGRSPLAPPTMSHAPPSQLDGPRNNMPPPPMSAGAPPPMSQYSSPQHPERLRPNYPPQPSPLPPDGSRGNMAPPPMQADGHIAPPSAYGKSPVSPHMNYGAPSSSNAYQQPSPNTHPSTVNGHHGTGDAPQYKTSPYPPPPSTPSGYPPTGFNARYPPQSVEPPPPHYSPSNQYPPPSAHRTPAADQRRLDPDNMPSPQPLSENLPSAIQVIEDDKKNKSGEFFTGNKGLVPPLVTTNYLVRDEGICSPRFIRSTIYNVPCTADMLKQTNVPFAITISPFARLNENETQPPISDLGELGPVRCNRCKAYMCPYMQFIDGGRRFHCVFCKATTDVPVEYFCHLDHNGMRSDMFTRPELCLGSYEFVATRQYCKNEELPNTPAYIFMIDVSYNSMRNGMVKLLCANLKSLLRRIPRPTDENSPRLKVGFVTYSNVVHFYNISGGAQPKLLTVPDVADMFMPLLTGFLVSLDEAESALDSLLELIPTIFGETKETETILGPVIQAGYEALKAANCAGKLFIFHSSLPIAEAPGKLKNRDDRKLLGTDKEKSLLIPQSSFYTQLGQQCVGVGCCVDLFLFPSAYMDVATLGQVCKLTGGHVYKYQYFQSDVDGEQFLEDLRRDVEQQIGFDAVMRVRTSQGIRPTDFYGHHYMSNTTDIELAGIDSSHALSVQIKYDDKLVDEECAYIQAALLYTSSTGQRRLRIHNLVLPTCNQMADLFRNCEQDTIMNYLAKDCVSKLVDQSSKAIKDKVIALAANMLGCYRKQCANSTSVGQLILPECMKLMPLYVNCLLKSDGISGSAEMLTDDRSLAMYSMGCMSVETSAGYLYPRLLPLHEVNPDSSEMPVALRCSREKVKEEGAYLLENGQLLFLYVGMGISPDWVMAVFNVPSPTHINSEKNYLPELNTPLSRAIWAIIRRIREERHSHMKMLVVRQGDKKMSLFHHLLVEDEGTGGPSYVNFLCHLHKEIRTLVN